MTLLNVVMGELTKHHKNAAPNSMLFADNIFVLGEIKKEMKEKLEEWNEALENDGLTLVEKRRNILNLVDNRALYGPIFLDSTRRGPE